MFANNMKICQCLILCWTGGGWRDDRMQLNLPEETVASMKRCFPACNLVTVCNSMQEHGFYIRFDPRYKKHPWSKKNSRTQFIHSSWPILTLEYACLSVCVSVTKRPHLTHYPQANTLSTHNQQTNTLSTRPERPKGAKDDVKQARRAQSRPEGPQARSRGPEGP